MSTLSQYDAVLKKKKKTGYIISMFVTVIFVSDLISSIAGMDKAGLPKGFYDIVINTLLIYLVSALVLYVCSKRLGYSFWLAVIGGFLWSWLGP